jgi:hypothetical protein
MERRRYGAEIDRKRRRRGKKVKRREGLRRRQ